MTLSSHLISPHLTSRSHDRLDDLHDPCDAPPSSLTYPPPSPLPQEAAADEAARLAMAAEDEEYATRSAEDRAALAARRERDLKVGDGRVTAPNPPRLP